jgi:hypothetical protein
LLNKKKKKRKRKKRQRERKKKTTKKVGQTDTMEREKPLRKSNMNFRKKGKRLRLVRKY